MGGAHGHQLGHLGDLQWDRDYGAPVNCSEGFLDARAHVWESEPGLRQHSWCFFMSGTHPASSPARPIALMEKQGCSSPEQGTQYLIAYDLNLQMII